MVSIIGEIPGHAAARFGDKTALIIEGRSFTFHELDALSNRVANGLISKGVVAGDRVTLYGANCWEWLVAYYGIAKCGAVLNPINVMLTPDEVRYVVEDAGSRAVVASADKGGPLLDLVGAANLADVVLWGDGVPVGATALAVFMEHERAEFTVKQVDPGELAMMGYFGNEQGTRETIEPDGWLHTGDIATMAEETRRQDF